MNKVSAFLNRKVFGVKVLYLLAVAVLGLAIAAYFVRPKDAEIDETSDDVTDDETGADVDGEVSDGDAETLYPSVGGGTVVVAPPADMNGTENEAIADNGTWLSKGVAFLVGKGVTGTAAQNALQTYLTGGTLSVTQQNYVDQVIAEYGVPPVDIETKAVKSRALVRYVRPTNGAGYFALYSDNTLHMVTLTELRALGKANSVQTVASSSPIWSYPVYKNGVRQQNYSVIGDADRIVGWLRVVNTDQFYAVRANGTVSRTTKESWSKNFGSPPYKTVKATDSRVKGK